MCAVVLAPSVPGTGFCAPCDRGRKRHHSRRWCWASASASCVSICTFVPVKQVHGGGQHISTSDVGVERLARSSSGVSICTFVPVKQVKWVPGAGDSCGGIARRWWSCSRRPSKLTSSTLSFRIEARCIYIWLALLLYWYQSTCFTGKASVTGKASLTGTKLLALLVHLRWWSCWEWMPCT